MLQNTVIKACLTDIDDKIEKVIGACLDLKLNCDPKYGDQINEVRVLLSAAVQRLSKIKVGDED